MENDYDRIPDELKQRDQWVLWKYEDGTKVLYHVAQSGRPKRAKSNRSSTWMSHDSALSHVDGYDGLGYVFAKDDPYIGIDLDDCLISGHILTEGARKIIDLGGSYAEVSPSGNGLKTIVKADSPIPDDRTGWNSKVVEMYDDRRWFAMTGNVWAGRDSITECQDQVDFVFETYFKDKLVERESIDTDFEPTEDPVIVAACKKYLNTNCEAVSGDRGHDAFFNVCCTVYQFGLSDQIAEEIIATWNDEKCLPPFDGPELEHKIKGARDKILRTGRFGSMEICRSVAQVSAVDEFDELDDSEESESLGNADEPFELWEVGLAEWIESFESGEVPQVYENALGVPLSPGEATIIGAAPGIGKTTLVTQVVTEVAHDYGELRILYASTEMPMRSLIEKQISMKTGIDAERLCRHKDKLTDDEKANIRSHIPYIEKFKRRMAMMRRPNTAGQLRRTMKAFQPDLLVLDYLQQFDVGEKERRLSINQLISDIREYCDRLDIAVLAISSLTRDNGKYRTGIAAFRESGELEYGVDNAFVMSKKDNGSFLLDHVKARYGRLRHISLDQKESLEFIKKGEFTELPVDVVQDDKTTRQNAEENQVTRRRRRRGRSSGASDDGSQETLGLGEV